MIGNGGTDAVHEEQRNGQMGDVEAGVNEETLEEERGGNKNDATAIERPVGRNGRESKKKIR